MALAVKAKIIIIIITLQSSRIHEALNVVNSAGFTNYVTWGTT